MNIYKTIKKEITVQLTELFTQMRML